jgi:hypothetical protein
MPEQPDRFWFGLIWLCRGDRSFTAPIPRDDGITGNTTGKIRLVTGVFPVMAIGLTPLSQNRDQLHIGRKETWTMKEW